jgi:hypothetical protein
LTDAIWVIAPESEGAMPSFRKLSNQEVDALLAERQKRKVAGQRALARQQYRDYLAQFRPGDWVVVEPTESESRITVKNRLLRAAKELGYELNFLRSRGALRIEIRQKKE